jgi:photosystem II stability/assembly factor-like uncharacterized protein
MYKKLKSNLFTPMGLFGVGNIYSSKEGKHFKNKKINLEQMKKFIFFFIVFLLRSFGGGGGGVLKADWVQVNNGLNNIIVNALCSYSSGGVNYIFAGTGNPGDIYLSTNDGNSWSLNYASVFEEDISKFAITNSGGVNYIYTATLGNIYRSTNNGANWLQLPFPNGSHDYYAIAASGNTVFAGLKWWSNDSGGVYISTNYGSNWTRTLYGPEIHAITINGNYVFAGAGGGANLVVGVFKSTDSGSSWIQTPFANTTVYSLVITGNYIFAGTSSFGVYLSTNNGMNWAQASLNYGTIKALLVYNNIVFAGGYVTGGFYLSSNNGLTWIQRNEGLGNQLNDLCISNGYIFAGTGGGGVYRRPLSELVGINSISNQIPSSYKLYQNYPNPFNSNSKIKIQISKLGDVKLKVYDILGRELETLINERLSPGIYESEFNGSNFSSGLYFYQLIADNKIIDTKKLILNK